MTQPVEGSLPSPKGFSLGMRKVPPSTLNLETVTTNTAGQRALSLASSGWGPGMLLSTPERTGHSHTTENALFFWAPKSLQMVTAAMKVKVKAQHEGALPPPCIVRKDPRVPHTARRGA